MSLEKTNNRSTDSRFFESTIILEFLAPAPNDRAPPMTFESLRGAAPIQVGSNPPGPDGFYDTVTWRLIVAATA
jgi:hypothetical protein